MISTAEAVAVSLYVFAVLTGMDGTLRLIIITRPLSSHPLTLDKSFPPRFSGVFYTGFTAVPVGSSLSPIFAILDVRLTGIRYRRRFGSRAEGASGSEGEPKKTRR